MANDEIIDLFDLVERGAKAAPQPAPSRDFRQDLDDLFDDAPAGADEQFETYSPRAARPQAARPEAAAPQAPVPSGPESDIDDLDGLLDDLGSGGGTDLEEPEPTMYFPPNMKKAADFEKDINLDDLQGGLDDMLAEAPAAAPAAPAPEVPIDNLDSLLDDILEAEGPAGAGAGQAEALFDELLDAPATPSEPPARPAPARPAPAPRATPPAAPRPAPAVNQERSVLLPPPEVAAPAAGGLTEAEIRALVQAEMAPLREAASAERIAALVQEGLAVAPAGVGADEVRALVAGAVANLPKPVSNEEFRTIVREEMAPLREAASAERIAALVSEQITALPAPLTEQAVREIVAQGLAGAQAGPAPEALRAMIHEEVAAVPLPRSLSVDEVRGIVCKELSALPKPLSQDEVKAVAQAQMTGAPTLAQVQEFVKLEMQSADLLSPQNVREIVRQELVSLPRGLDEAKVRELVAAEKPAADAGVSVEEVRELVQAEVFAAMPDGPPVTASQIRGVVREEMDLRFTALEEKLTAKLLEENGKNLDQAAARAAAVVIREELAALAQDL